MQIPGTMTAPRPRLDDGEAIELSAGGLRKKGWFGNLFGELHVTSRRVIFVKAIMRSGLISAAANARGAAPKLAFDRAGLVATREPWKKQHALVLTAGDTREMFVLAEADIERFLAALAPR